MNSDANLAKLLADNGATIGEHLPDCGGEPTDCVLHFGDARAEYDALTTAAAVVDFSHRTQIEMTGSDAPEFLHNLCTNEIRKLSEGSGCEAFLTDAQGHTLALVYVFRGAEAIVLETVSQQEATLLQHLDRYLIREKVELRGRTADWAELLLAGPAAADVLRRAAALALDVALPTRWFEHGPLALGDTHGWVRRIDLTWPGGFLVACPRSQVAGVWRRLRSSGAAACGMLALESARIEAGTPFFGRDVTTKNLPQEVARDQRAISFVKGCYIGQETVARIDALGHVNRTLQGVRFFGQTMPATGTTLTLDEKPVAQVTSAAWSYRLDAPLALAYVRREANAVGTRLESPHGATEIVPLPVAF